MKHASLILLAGLALMACTPSTAPEVVVETPVAEAPAEPAAAPPVDMAAPPEDACNAAQYAAMVGEPATLAGLPPAGPDVRHIRPDTQVTMDFRPERLNIDIDAADLITGFRCG